MGIESIPRSILGRYHVEERWHACAILSVDFPQEFRDILECLEQFELVRSEIAVGGGGGTCPLLLVAIETGCYRDDIPHEPIRSEMPIGPPASH